MNLFPSEALTSLISNPNLLKQELSFFGGYSHLSESLLRYCANYLFVRINNPYQDVKLLYNGEVSYLAEDACDNGMIGYYPMALLLSRNKTLVYNHLEKRMTEFYKLYNYLFQAHHLLTHFNIYWSPAESVGAGMHMDDHDVIIIQLLGDKKWHLEQGDVNLTAGDVLYIKKGTPHNPVTQRKSQSLHLTIGVVRDGTYYPQFQKPSGDDVTTPDVNSLDFIRSMGCLFNGEKLIMYLGRNVSVKEENDILHFIYEEKTLSLKKAILIYLFEYSDFYVFKTRERVCRNDVINVVLSFYKMNIPVRLEGSAFDV